MSSNSEIKTKDNSPKRKYNLRKKKKKNYKLNQQPEKSDSDDSEDSDWLPDNNPEEEEELSTLEMQRLMQKIFPSKGGKERLKQLDKLDKLVEKTNKKKHTKLGKKKSKEDKQKHTKIEKKKKKKKKKKSDTDSDEERKFMKSLAKFENEMIQNEITQDDDDDEGEIMENEELNNMKFNIIFTLGDNYQEEEEEDDEEDEEEESEDDEKEIKNPSFILHEKVKVLLKDWGEPFEGTIIKVRKNGHYNVRLDDEEYSDIKDIGAKYMTSIFNTNEEEKLIQDLSKLLKKKKTKNKEELFKYVEKLTAVHTKRKTIQKKELEKKEKNKNALTLKKLLKKKSVTNDFKYFKTMTLENQIKILNQLKEVNSVQFNDKPYRISLLESDMPLNFKAIALNKINTLSMMDPCSGEYYKVKHWVDGFMRIPFGKYIDLPITLSDGTEKCCAFMKESKKILDDCVFGLEDAKMQILQYIGQWISNPSTIGTAIAIHGPPGTGKTTLIKEGISKILKRPFAFAALGGSTDSSWLEGHSYTYEGSTWGKVVDILMQSKCMNPVIFMDELDKISDTPKGEEITGILTHLTDTTQNDKFHDKYYSSVDFNISRALFIFSYNNPNKINPILKDRMYRIHTKGYDKKQKIVIATDYLIPTIEKNINFEKKQIIIPEETLVYLIENYTEEEAGVRNLKRSLEIVYTKLNLYRLMEPGTTLFDKKTTLDVSFPYTVTTDIIQKLIKKTKKNPLLAMYL